MTVSGRRGSRRRLTVGGVAAATALLASVLASPMPAAAQTRPFPDTPEEAYYSAAVVALHDQGLFGGTLCADDMFCPDEPIDRKTMAVWTVRALDRADPEPLRGTRFSDVSANSIHAPFIKRAAQLGIATECGARGRFCPDNIVTRSEMAAVLTRAFRLEAGPDPGFSDVSAKAPYFNEVAAVAASGLTAGCGDGGRFCPRRPTARAQMATFLARALQLVDTPPLDGSREAASRDETVLEPIARLTGRLSPKSVVASGHGLYFAQNLMYRHTISVFDHNKELVATIDDAVDLSKFGFASTPGIHRGAPVEAAFTSDGSFVFVSNYRMYGAGYDPSAGSDSCKKDEGRHSFVYRIDVATLSIDRLYRAGPVPKFMAVTPDDRLLLVSNWCGFDVTVIDLATHETVAEIDVGRYPRGIAVTGDSRTAYVAVMGSTDIAVIDLSPYTTAGDAPVAVERHLPASFLRDVGSAPRHLVLSPDDALLYVTLNGEGAVVAVDAGTGREIMRAYTGAKPRTMDISDDGTALYLVNYRSNTVSKLRASDFKILQTLNTSPRPIGLTYDSFNDELWVSTFAGVIHVYAETQP